jgi:hypothetical protein
MKKVWQWFTKLFKTVKDDADKLAIAFTEEVKDFITTPLAGGLAVLIDTTFKTHLAEEGLAFLKKNIYKILALELGLQALSDDPTEQEILDFENAVIKTVTGLDAFGKSKLWSTFAAQVLGIIKSHEGDASYTYAQLIKDVEEAYQDYLQDLAGSQENGSDTTVEENS